MKNVRSVSECIRILPFQWRNCHLSQSLYVEIHCRSFFSKWTKKKESISQLTIGDWSKETKIKCKETFDFDCEIQFWSHDLGKKYLFKKNKSVELSQLILFRTSILVCLLSIHFKTKTIYCSKQHLYKPPKKLPILFYL